MALAGDRLVVGAGCPIWWIMGLCDYANAAALPHGGQRRVVDAPRDADGGRRGAGHALRVAWEAAAGHGSPAGRPTTTAAARPSPGPQTLRDERQRRDVGPDREAQGRRRRRLRHVRHLRGDGGATAARAFGDGNAGSDGQNNPVGAVGAVYVFRASDGAQLAKLTAARAATGDMFGFSVAIEGSTVARGPRRRQQRAPSTCTTRRRGPKTTSDGIAGDLFGYLSFPVRRRPRRGAMGDDGSAGSVYLFRTDGTTWTQYDEVTARRLGWGRERPRPLGGAVRRPRCRRSTQRRRARRRRGRGLRLRRAYGYTPGSGRHHD